MEYKIAERAGNRAALAKKTAALSPGRTEVVLMTPEKALEILERFSQAEKDGKVRNRPVSDTRVEMLTKSILTGAWKVTHQGIALDTDGLLLDGQHRLWAIVKSKTAVPILVTYDADPGIMPVIDRGRSRSLGNVLHILGERYGGTKAGIGRILSAFVVGNGSDDIRHYRQTDEVVVNFVERYKADIEWFTAVRRSGAFSSAPLAAVMVYSHHSFSKPVEHAAERFISGVGLSKGDPIHTLREKIIGDTSDVLLRRYGSKIVLMKYAFNAFAHAVRGEPYFRVTDSMAGYEFFKVGKANG